MLHAEYPTSLRPKSQFSAFVNGNAEKLRSSFVAHQGQKTLGVAADGDLHTADYSRISHIMAKAIHENVVDKQLAKWIIPEFSTTTQHDKTIACIMMMATLKTYFAYESAIACGIPRVTLEGSKEDWEVLRLKAEKLKEYGVECIAWYHLLAPVLDGFVRAFDQPDSQDNMNFWQRIADMHNMGSEMTYLRGWITAFCVFDTLANGKWTGPPLREVRRYEPGSLSIDPTWTLTPVPSSCTRSQRGKRKQRHSPPRNSGTSSGIHTATASPH